MTNDGLRGVGRAARHTRLAELILGGLGTFRGVNNVQIKGAAEWNEQLIDERHIRALDPADGYVDWAA